MLKFYGEGKSISLPVYFVEGPRGRWGDPMKKLKHAWSSRSFRTKLILTSVFCVLLPLILAFIMMYHLVQDELVQNSVDQSNDALEMLDIQLSDFFDNLLYLSNYIQFNDSLKLTLLRTIERAEQGELTPAAKAFSDLEIERNLETVTNLLVPSYLSIVVDDVYAYTNYRNINWNAELLQELQTEIMNNPRFGIYWIGVHPNYMEAGNETVPYVVSIAGALELTEKHKAFILISVHEAEVRSLLNERTFDLQQDIMLVDVKGTVVSHNKQDLTRKPFPFAAELQAGGGYRLVQYHEKDYVMVSQPFSYGDWTIVSLIPQRRAIGNIQNIITNTLIALILFFLLFLLLLIVLVSLLTKPLKRLNYVMEQVKVGNLQIRSGLKGRGDLEQLGQSWDAMMDTVEQMIEKIKFVEKGKRKAELEMLQAQINPHFLFNTLNSVRLRISLNGDEESSKILQTLSMLLRMTFNRKDEFVTLQKEVEVVRHYLQLMNFKSNATIQLEEDLEQDTLDFKVPRFFLQPLIENSIFHGFKQKNGTITIASRSEGDGVMIRVADDGKGMSPEALQLLRNELCSNSVETAKRNQLSFTGIGIGNVHQRMRLIYGDRFRMEIDNLPSGGAQIVFFIPKHDDEV